MNSLRLNQRKWFPVAALNKIKNLDKTRKLLFYFKITLWDELCNWLGANHPHLVKSSSFPEELISTGFFGNLFRFDIRTRCDQMEKEIEKKTDLGHILYIEVET